MTVTGIDLVQQFRMLPAPALVAYMKLLALPGAELEQTVADELAQNPALVQEEAATCAMCGLPADPPCPYCAAETGGSRSPWTRDLVGPLPDGGPVARVSWAECLLRDLRLMVDRRDTGIAAVVVASLDDRGYLTEDMRELARAARADVTAVERVVRTLRETGPPGVGARDLRDCLLLQIDRFGAQGARHQVTRAVVADHLEALGRGATASIARRLGVSAEEVAAAREFIRRELLPRPLVQADPVADDSVVVPLRPDVAVFRSAYGPGSWRIDVLEERRLGLSVDPCFRRMATDSAAISGLVRRGDFFLARLRDRWSTMRRITEYVVNRRPDLLGDEPAVGSPLTRADVGAGLGLNPSTVSRATVGRYVLLPSRCVVPYAAFFDGSLNVRSQLQHIIVAENRPLSDAELCERLKRAGHDVARRTVAKYRSRLQILPSTHR